MRERKRAFCCPGVSPNDASTMFCDFNYAYTVVLESTNPVRDDFLTVSKPFKTLVEARRHALIYSAYKLRKCYMTGYPHAILVSDLEPLMAWLTAQGWEEDRDYRTESFYRRAGEQKHLLWFQDERHAIMAKAVWGEAFVID